MTKRTKSEMLETLKAEDNPSYEKAQIEAIKDIETKYGDKTIITLEDVNSEAKFNVFVNAYSMNKLIEAFGEEDKKWVGKNVSIGVEKDEKFNKDMIVLTPLE